MKIRRSPRTRKVYKMCTLRAYTKSAVLAVNANDGRDLDNTQEIADEYRRDREGIEDYFKTKEESIRRDYRIDSNSAAASGVSASELHDWLEERNNLLEQLEGQKEDAKDLASIYSVDEEDDSDNNDSHETNQENQATSNDNSESSSSAGFPQDSSDIMDTDFSSFEPFEE